MKLKTLDETTVKYFIGNKFYFFKAADNFLYEDGKKTDKKDGIKVTIYSEENPTEFLKVKVNGKMSDVADYKIHQSIDFENLTGNFWIKTSGNYNSQELSLKADGIRYLLAK
jgi:hypothetical protein